MKGLRNFIDKIKPNFEKGGKFEKLHSTFDAFETFLFVPNHVTRSGSHIRDSIDLKRVMIVVVVALMPALLFGMYNTGLQHFRAIGAGDAPFWTCFWFGLLKVLPIIIVSYVVGLGIEFISAQIRHHEVNEGFLVSGMLIPLVMPVDVPLWMVAVATAFAVIIGKEVFGGTGMNVFNPALLARAFAFFAYTPSMSGATVWIAGMTEDMKNVAANIPGYVPQVVDGFSGATALENLSTTGQMGYSAMDAFLGFIPGCIGETSTLAILLGAAILLFTGVASWRTMVSVFVGGLAMGYFFQAIGVTTYPAWYHLIIGGFAFGAVFMATDPVTSAQTNTGKYIVGLLTGALAVLIRVVNPAYPEGMMLSILFMNALAPLVDYYVVEANISRRKKRVKLAK